MWRSTGFKQWRLLFCLLRLWRIRMMTMTATTKSVTMRAERVPTMIPIMSFSVVASFVWTERSSTCCCESEIIPNPKALNQVRSKIKSYSLVGTGTFACFIIQLLFKILPELSKTIGPVGRADENLSGPIVSSKTSVQMTD